VKILIDALSARIGGGITYIRSILPALYRADNRHEYHVLLSERYQESLIEGLPPGTYPLVVSLQATPLIYRWWYLQTEVPRILRDGLFHMLFTVAEIGTVNAPCPSVVLVRNNVFFAKKSAFSPFQRLQLVAYRAIRQPFVYLTLYRADRLVFVSDAFRQEVTKQKRRLSQAKTCVIHHGISPDFNANSTLARGNSIFDGHPYLLAVSTLMPHKNYETLLNAFARLKFSAPHLHLVIAGSINHGSLYHALLTLAEKLAIIERVHFSGEVPHEKLPALYRQASAFILSSRLESFCHPLVEAMACGVPVIASDLPVCQEICQDAALYFSPNDIDTLVDHIMTVTCNPAVRNTMVQKGLGRAQQFSWDRTAEKLLQVLEEVSNMGHY